MKLNQLYFDLPDDLIAQTPAQKRGDSRLLVYERSSGKVLHSLTARLDEFLSPDTLMVFNDSKVRKARVFGKTAHGGKIEFLFLKKQNFLEWKVICSRGSRQKPGSVYDLPGGLQAECVEDLTDSKIIRLSGEADEAWFEKYGHIPLPPYIKRPDEAEDSSRYQTVFASQTGSAAAPTAGLHFTPELLKALESKGIRTTAVTLHVGPGTFIPVRSDNVEDHVMHFEDYDVGEQTAALVNEYKAAGKPVLAVGTTSVRTLESAWKGDALVAGPGSTGIFITPGYRFRVVDKLMTNFHTPYSTLLLLVGAFAGLDKIKELYSLAIAESYRFFSYGDAMLIL